MWTHLIGLMDDRNQILLKKYKEFTDELKNYQSTIDALHEQASALGEESSPVVERLSSIDSRYKELCEVADIRKQRLRDALLLYRLSTEANESLLENIFIVPVVWCCDVTP